MSISDELMRAFTQDAYETMEYLKLCQKKLQDMMVSLKAPLGTARMNSNTEEIKILTEMIEKLKKIQRSIIADSHSLSYINDDFGNTKETSEANAKLREEERKRVDANKAGADPRGTYRRQRKIEEARSNDESPRKESSIEEEHDESFGVLPPSDEGEGYDERPSDRERQYRKKVDETYQGKEKRPYQGKGKRPYQEKEKRPYQEKGKGQHHGNGQFQGRRNEWNRNDERRQYRDERGAERRTGGGRKYKPRQYEGDREDERRTGGGRKYQPRQYRDERGDERRSGGGRRYQQRR